MDRTLLVLLIFWLFVLYYNYRQIKKAEKSENLSDKKLIMWTQCILFIGVLLRTVYLHYPFGLHLDEAINGYESWCLTNYGVDQHLASYPVYFKSWGSGQSALYAYLSIPFIKLFGLTASSYRLVMAITGSISLLAFYGILNRTQTNKFFVLLATLFLAINPWHIMKSRWALDCNLSPDLILIGAALFVAGYVAENRKGLYYSIGCVFFALAAYSYGINWFMLPLFLPLLTFFFYKKKQITVKQILACGTVLLIFLFPLILFALQLVSGGEAYTLGGMTIPQLDSSRHEATTIFGSTEPFGMFRHYMKRAAILIFWGDDKLGWNSFLFFGQFFNLLGLPFIAISIREMYKTRKLSILDSVFLIWLIAMIPIVLFVEPNVNHWNALWFPLIYFCGKGIFLIVQNSALKKKIALIGISSLGLVFSIVYFNAYNKPDSEYGGNDGIKNAIEFANSLDVDVIYNPGISNALTLFYAPVDPYEYRKTVVMSDKLFDNVKQYSRFRFELPSQIDPMPRTAYIVYNPQRTKYEIDESQFKKWNGSTFTIYWNE